MRLFETLEFLFFKNCRRYRKNIEIVAPKVPPRLPPDLIDLIETSDGAESSEKALEKLKLCFLRIGEIQFEEENGLRKKVGMGNFGKVYLARISNTRGSLFCVKEIIDEENRNEFIKEALVMLRLSNHVNVLGLSYLAYESNRKCPILITAYMKNGSLISFLRSSNAILYDLALRWSAEAACGMKHLSSEGIVHRDLAARNCLLSDDFTLKICDFGLSRKTDHYIGCGYYKQKNRCDMPFRWLAPEALELKKFSSKTDLWSFGILMWEIFTRGHVPYKEIATVRELKEYLSKEFETEVLGIKKPQRLRRPPKVTDDLWPLIESTWHPDPKYRPSFENLSYSLKILTKEYKSSYLEIDHLDQSYRTTVQCTPRSILKKSFQKSMSEQLTSVQRHKSARWATMPSRIMPRDSIDLHSFPNIHVADRASSNYYDDDYVTISQETPLTIEQLEKITNVTDLMQKLWQQEHITFDHFSLISKCASEASKSSPFFPLGIKMFKIAESVHLKSEIADMILDYLSSLSMSTNDLGISKTNEIHANILDYVKEEVPFEANLEHYHCIFILGCLLKEDLKNQAPIEKFFKLFFWWESMIFILLNDFSFFESKKSNSEFMGVFKKVLLKPMWWSNFSSLLSCLNLKCFDKLLAGEDFLVASKLFRNFFAKVVNGLRDDKDVAELGVILESGEKFCKRALLSENIDKTTRWIQNFTEILDIAYHAIESSINQSNILKLLLIRTTIITRDESNELKLVPFGIDQDEAEELISEEYFARIILELLRKEDIAEFVKELKNDALALGLQCLYQTDAQNHSCTLNKDPHLAGLLLVHEMLDKCGYITLPGLFKIAIAEIIKLLTLENAIDIISATSFRWISCRTCVPNFEQNAKDRLRRGLKCFDLIFQREKSDEQAKNFFHPVMHLLWHESNSGNSNVYRYHSVFQRNY